MKLTEYNKLMTKMMTMMIVLMIPGPSEIDPQPVDEENDDNDYNDDVKLAN